LMRGMVKERVANELRTALDALRRERDEIDEQIDLMEGTLSKLGVERSTVSKKRKTSKKKKAAKRKATKKKATTSKKRRPTKKKAAKKAGAKKKSGTKKKKPYWSPAARAAARERMRKYWAERRKAEK